MKRSKVIRDAESSALNSSLGAPFALVKKFGNNRLKSSFIPNFFTNTKLPPQNTRICDLKNEDSATRAENAESALDSAESQNLFKNQSCEAPLISPASWCKKSDLRLQKCNHRFFARSGESEALPLKAKKRSFLARRGSGVGGAALFAKKANENNSNGFTESTQESQGGLPRRFCESARNDEFIIDSSLHKCSAQNDNVVVDSTILQNQFFPAKKSLRLAESRGKFLPNTALIALGANLKNPIATFKSLFTKLARNAKIHILSTSPIYKNPPFGYANQPFFYNATILLATKMCLLEFYAFIFYLERIFGRNRKRAFKNAPRTLDIDIIFFNDIFMRSSKLNIPHPQWQTRPSVLVPLIFQVHYKGF